MAPLSSQHNKRGVPHHNRGWGRGYGLRAKVEGKRPMALASSDKGAEGVDSDGGREGEGSIWRGC